jgi:hypothetical protein
MFNSIISSPDLFLLVTFTGMILCGVNAVATRECGSSLLHNLHLLTYVVLSLLLGWSAIYGYRNGWSPWPPDLFFFAVFDGMLIIRLLKRRKMMRVEIAAKRERWGATRA